MNEKNLNMAENKDVEEYKKLVKLIHSKIRRWDKEWLKKFFENDFNNYELNERIQIINDITENNETNIMRLLSNNNFPNKIKEIISATIKEAANTYSSDSFNEMQNAINTFWLNMLPARFELNNTDLTNFLKKITNELNNNNISYNNSIIRILKCYMYSLVNEKIVRDDDNKSFDYFEKLVVNYLNSIPLEEEFQKNDFVMLLFELKEFLNSNNINAACENLFNRSSQSDSMEKYNDFINTMIMVPTESLDDFCNNVSLYRMKKGILPEKICNYIIMFYNENDFLYRMAEIDIIKYFLLNKNIENVAVCKCDQLPYGGIAGTKYLMMPCSSVFNYVLFHEATHVIQNNEIRIKNIFSGKNYLIEKDFALRDIFGWRFYMINHDSFIFEVDADIQGKRYYAEYVKNINGTTEDLFYVTPMNQLEEEEDRRMENAKYIRNGEKTTTKYSKSRVFDCYIGKCPQIIQKRPILKLEYTDDGNRKSITEILKSLELELNKRDKNEINDIANCIFTDEYLSELPMEKLSELNGYVTSNDVVLSIVKKIIEKLKINIANINNKEKNNNDIGDSLKDQR